MLHAYRTRGEMEEWYTPCHGIPQFEYTHFDCQQLVQSIVKQEELGMLKTAEGRNDAIESGSSVKDLPEPVLNALLGMPVTNQRMAASKDGGKGGSGSNGGEAKKWYDYYDQESLNVTFELYQHDFEIFRYSPVITQRPDLVSPQLAQDVLASSSNVDGASFENGCGGAGGGVEEEANGGHKALSVDHDVETAGSATSVDADHSYQELRRIGTTHSHGAAVGSADDGQLSRSGGSVASCPGFLTLSPSSSVELMRRNSNDKETDRERRLKLIMSSTHVPSRRTSMRREPLGISLVTTGSVASSSLSSVPWSAAGFSGVTPTPPSTVPTPRGAAATTSTPSATATAASSMSSYTHTHTHTTTNNTTASFPSPPRLSVLVPTHAKQDPNQQAS
jgi:hypothetical protein